MNSGAPLEVSLLGATVCADTVSSKRHKAGQRRGKEAKAMDDWVRGGCRGMKFRWGEEI